MVKVIGYKEKEKEGTKFYVLVLQGRPEIVKSLNTGKSYMTVRKASLSCTFDEETCKSLIGEMFIGSIVKVQCETYEYVVPETGEIIRLDFRYEYSENSSIEEAVFETV